MKKSWHSFVQLLKESLAWSEGAMVSPSRIVISMLALSAPIVLGEILHNVALGVNIAIAGYVIGTDVLPEKAWGKFRALSIEILAMTLAMGIGLLLSSPNLTSKILFLVVVTIFATLGSLSVSVARLCTLFIIMMIIARSLGQHGADPVKATGLFFLGSLWIMALIFFLQPLIDSFLPQRLKDISDSRATQEPSWRHLWVHWKNSLKHFSGWLYVIRLVSSLIAAEICVYFWPNAHSYWIFITIVIVVHRNPHEALKKKIQRTLGTLVGVTVAGLLLIWHPSLWLGLALILFLTGARPVIKVKNYAAYSLLMTLFVMLLFDLSSPPTVEVLKDRLLATILGSLISFFLGYYCWRDRILKSTP